jgi:hypothetical protein
VLHQTLTLGELMRGVHVRVPAIFIAKWSPAQQQQPLRQLVQLGFTVDGVSSTPPTGDSIIADVPVHDK